MLSHSSPKVTERWLLTKENMLELSVSLAQTSDGVRLAIELYSRRGDLDPRMLLALEFANHYIGKMNEALLAVVSEGGL